MSPTIPLVAPFLLTTLIAQTAPPPTAAAEISWLTDFGAARALARQTHAPLFVTFRCER